MSSSIVASSPAAVSSFGGGSTAFFAPPAHPQANYIYDLAPPPASSSSGAAPNSPSTSQEFPYVSQQQMIDNCAAYARRLRDRQKYDRYGTFDEQDSSYYIGAVRRGALFCRSGTWLEVVDDWQAREETRRGSHKGGTVRGTRNSNSSYNILEFISVAIGLVSIRGVKSEKYVCMNQNGSLYSTSHRNFSSECIFMEEMMENYYNLYSSCLYGSRHQPWYLALRRTGRPRKGPNTKRRRKSSHFLVAHFDSSPPKRPPGENGPPLEHLILPSLIHQPPKKKGVVRSLTMDSHPPTKSPVIEKISARVELAPILKKRKEKRKRRREQRLLREERRRKERQEMLRRLREQERRNDEGRWKGRQRLSGAGLQIVEKPTTKYNNLHYSSIS